MLLTLHTFFSLFFVQVCACETNPICPIPIMLSSNEQRLLEQEMLSLLDVDKRPPKMSSKKVKYSTKFMMDLYKIISDATDEKSRVKKRSASARNRLRPDEIVKAATSDIILSMNCVNKKSDGVGQRQKLAFSMTHFPKEVRLVDAELKLYQNKKKAKKLPYNMYTISVYKPYEFTSELIKMKQVGEKITSTDFTGWLSIDISYVFNIWLQYQLPVQDLYVSAQPLTAHQEKEIHPSSIGVTFQNEQLMEKEPFIVAFLQADNTISSRLPRNINSKRFDLMDILTKRDKCNMYALKVSFKDLGWSDWVIAPDGYTSAFCQGTCDFPLKYPVQATHHALIQSLMHLKNPKKFPQPSCTPTETSQLSVLFKRKENTILKNYRNMIVRGCGCQ